ncbi:MAG TPA: hypothetical protein DCL21_02860 [Alphaproteobacteria bacterium]|nr:hypothetical protein [Alphaproteobacteria bacterium]
MASEARKEHIKKHNVAIKDISTRVRSCPGINSETRLDAVDILSSLSSANLPAHEREIYARQLCSLGLPQSAIPTQSEIDTITKNFEEDYIDA